MDRSRLPSSASPQIDGFSVGELLHSSPLARLYRVTSSGTGPSAAFPMIMKIPQTGPGEGGQGLLGFETEARVLGAVAGPHVPRFVAAGDIGTNPYLVMELIEGRRLEEVRKGVPLAVDDVAKIGAAVADALHSLHAQGVIHLDLKPENIILRPAGEAVLIDFGMAHHERFPDLLAEERRFASGSAPYISPEQVHGDRSDVRSDIFALGVILYELATGELPFGVPVTLAGLGDRRWLEPRPPRAIAPALAPWLQEVILRCIEPAVEARYQSAAHVAFDLRHPQGIELTARARKLQRAGALRQAKRWWAARKEALGPPRTSRRAESAPVIMVAVDTMHPDDARHPALIAATAQILSLSREFRLICVSVVRGEPLGTSGDRGVHFEHLVRLRHWVQPLRLPETRLSLHVIESLSPSGALLDFARNNNVDLIVIGAPGPSQEALAWWRSVASGVTANAHCSVHVVRVSESVG